MKRRKFITAAGLATGGLLIPVGLNSWVTNQATAQSGNSKRLVVVMLRGGMDGLNVVVPHQEANYYQTRPTIAVPYPQAKNGVLDLDGFFGLNPELKNLMPFWKQKNLGFVHCSGLPVTERSHFQAQDYLENGTPGMKSTADGWMNRLLGELSADNLTQALNVGLTTPYILKGKMKIANLKPGKNSIGRIPTDNPRISEAFDSLYSGSDNLSQAYQNGRKVREKIMADLKQEMQSASRGAKNVNAFVDDAAEVAQLMVGNTRTQIAFMQVGGWDSHINQNMILNRLLKPLGEGLTTLVNGLESIYSDTVIVVMSEFGRTAQENGTRGTDHGHGNVMFVLGGAVNGRKVHGGWSGLNQSDLHQGRELAVTTDYREVISHILQNHLSISDQGLSRIFPDFKLANKLDLLA